jgi:hypothetical protein
MTDFDDAAGKPLSYLLVQTGDRVVVEGVALDDLEKRKNAGLLVIDGPFESQQMADAALGDYLGDRRIS